MWALLTLFLSPQIQALQSARSDCYRQYDEAIGKFKQSKDSALLAAAKKKVEADHKTASSAIGDQLDILKSNSASSDVLERVHELQKLDQSFKEQVSTGINFKFLFGRWRYENLHNFADFDWCYLCVLFSVFSYSGVVKNTPGPR